MIQSKSGYTYLMFFLVLFIFSGCRDEENKPVQTSLKFSFRHTVQGANLITDEMIYTNAAGNEYEVSEIMYFISDLKLYHQDGRVIEPASWDDIHYVDTNIPETFEWAAGNDIPEGNYDSLTFTFGISEEKNQSFMFVNPPEVNMAWPELLGGGYHYLMLNGWWKDLQGHRLPYNFHLGIGQIYENNSGLVEDITGFVQNSFTINPGGGVFTIESGKDNTAILNMEVNSWFSTPEIFDFNYYGGAIMQNQEAMHIGCLNGRDIFSISWN
ncbi:MAG: MbnP family protein [Lentimicrobium sp.]